MNGTTTYAPLAARPRAPAASPGLSAQAAPFLPAGRVFDPGAAAPLAGAGHDFGRVRVSAEPAGVIQRLSDDEAARKIQGAWKRYSGRMKAAAPQVTDETRQHVHVGDNRQPPGAGAGLWSGGGLHSYGGLQNRVQGEGVTIDAESTDALGVVKAKVTRPNYGKNNKLPGGKKGHKASEPYTLYPKDTTPLQSDRAGQSAFRTALAGKPNTQLVPPSAAQPEGRYTAYAPVARSGGSTLARVQGYYKDNAGNPEITSHHPLASGQQDVVANRRFQKWQGKNNWQKLLKLGYIDPEQAEQMKAQVAGRHARKYADYLKRGKKKDDGM